MSDGFPVSINDAQWQEILTTIAKLSDHAPFWVRIVSIAAPTFLAFILGLASALFLDHLKSRRESRKLLHERDTKELTQLNIVSTAMAFNLETLIHFVMDQIIPHYRDSHSAEDSVISVRTIEQFREFSADLDIKYKAMVTKSPEPYFLEIDFFKEIPFVLAKDPELLKRSGWMVELMRDLKSNLRDRNERINSGGLTNTSGGMTLDDLKEHIRIQAVIGNAEVVHSQQLFEHILAICKSLEQRVGDYKHVQGPHLKVSPPDGF